LIALAYGRCACGSIPRHIDVEGLMADRSIAASGITFGSALAITISWSLWHSVLWAIIHGFFSWFYVIYYLLTRSRQ
jgi:hypothetical protein